MDKEKFICPHCKARLTMYEHYIEYYDPETIVITEHYECPECHGYIEEGERIATYEIKKETWH